MPAKDRHSAPTGKPLTPAERKARVDALVASGKLTPQQAGLVRYDETVPETIREAARKLAPKGRRALTRAAQDRKAA